MNIKHKDYDTSTLEGLRKAEKYKARLQNQGYTVTVNQKDVNGVEVFGYKNA